MLLRYEDLALTPLETAKRLYKFAGFNPEAKGLEAYLKDHTESSQYESNRLGTIRDSK